MNHGAVERNSFRSSSVRNGMNSVLPATVSLAAYFLIHSSFPRNPSFTRLVAGRAPCPVSCSVCVKAEATGRGNAMLDFNKRILFVGFGAVARCTLPILVKHVNVPPGNVTIMDFEPNEAALRPWLAQGMTFVKDRITPDNLGSLLGRFLSAGDLLIDLAWNIDCCEIVQWCHDHGVLYINTSVELWDPYSRPGTHTHRADPLLAAHEPAPARGRLERTGADRGPRARGQPRTDQPLHQAGPARHRRASAGRPQVRRRAGRDGRLTTPAVEKLQPPGPSARRQGDPLQRARHADHRSAQAGR